MEEFDSEIHIVFTVENCREVWKLNNGRKMVALEFEKKKKKKKKEKRNFSVMAVIFETSYSECEMSCRN